MMGDVPQSDVQAVAWMTDTTKTVEPVAIDIRAAFMDQIENAAKQSSWVPDEYMMNEVISDCCRFLTLPHPATALDAANAEIERLTKELEAREQQCADLLDETVTCACGYDGPNDVCAKHYPLFRRLKARAEKAEAESAALVAAAYADAASLVPSRDDLRHLTQNAACDLLAERRCQIRALTPADATAALEARDAAKVREGWEAGMQDAADLGPNNEKWPMSCREFRDAILAAIKEKQP